VWLGQKKEPLKSSAPEIVAALEQSRVAGIRRMGKHIVFDLERSSLAREPSPVKGRGSKKLPASGAKLALALSILDAEAGEAARPTKSRVHGQWIVHLGMTGRLQLCEARVEIEKHTHAILRLASGRELRFVDPRRFGRLSVSADFDAGGIEPLDIDLDRFVALFRGRKTPIKSALLNQKLLRGVGNIYADESLFRAGIRPHRRASSLNGEKLGKLFVTVKEVLKEAIALGGSSISDYVDDDGKEGFFQHQHRVYGREDEACLVCKSPIKRIVIGGRSSHYCARCQK
jgi:formamidopyrimidine-DNA glycosylase